LAIARDDEGQLELLQFTTDRSSSDDQSEWRNRGFVTEAPVKEPGFGIVSVAWSPNPRPGRVAFSANWASPDKRGWGLYISPVLKGNKLGEPKPFLTAGNVCELSWSSDGKRLVFADIGFCVAAAGPLYPFNLADQKRGGVLGIGANPAWQPGT
jgi:hypothetical protein